LIAGGSRRETKQTYMVFILVDDLGWADIACFESA
jgi:hypothetical protein